MSGGTFAGSTWSKLLIVFLILLPSTVLVAIFSAPSVAAERGAPLDAAPAKPVLNYFGKPDIHFSGAELKTLEKGDLVIQRKAFDGVDRGTVVRDIAAPPEAVFAEVAAIEKYVGRVPMLAKLQVYHEDKQGAWKVVKAQYTNRVLPGYAYNNFVEHHLNAKQKVLNFDLDPARKSESDFEMMSGRWFIEHHPKKSDWSRAYYQVELKFPGVMPGFVKSFLIKSGLNSAMAWVKAACEGTDMPAEGPVSAMPMAAVSLAIVATCALCSRGARALAARTPRFAAAPAQGIGKGGDAAPDPAEFELGSTTAPPAS